MKKSDLFPALNDIAFASKDPDTITREILSAYENASGRTLSQSDPVRIFLDVITLIIIQQRNLIDIAAKNNLIAYAEGDYLDHIGALFGVTRLGATHASCNANFFLDTPQNYSDFIIPKGTRVTADGKITFSTVYEAETTNGIMATVELVCDTAGTIGNGFLPGQINKIVDRFPFSLSVENITESAGGTDRESDEAFRERIHIAPEHYSTAGPVKAYEYYAKSADADIIDVKVLTPPDTQPGHVAIIPLMTGGTLPSENVLNKVMEAVNADDIRPDTDFVAVIKPEIVYYSVKVNYWVENRYSAMLADIHSAVNQAVNDWILWQKSKLGRDINPSELIRRIITSGAKRCVILSPAFTVLQPNQIAYVSDSLVSFAGLEDS